MNDPQKRGDQRSISHQLTKNMVSKLSMKPWCKRQGLECQLGFDRMEASFANLQTLMEERLPRKPEVVQLAAQPRQGEQAPSNATLVQANLREHFPITPQEGQGVPLGAEMRNAMPMRPLNQDFRVQANQLRFGMPMGEGLNQGKIGQLVRVS
uniref:Uncharacterized protein n=1 Tax=Fagus sylvatica TaxID=28930 RepID=A0A2N9EGI2_FAGSY